MDGTTLQIACWLLAFWTALFGYLARAGERELGARFVVGLALGAVLAHLGWALLQIREVLAEPRAFLLPSVGYTILPVPLGLLATAPWREAQARRTAWLAAAFGALPLAFCVARLGCVLAGCCHGTPTALPWGVTPQAGGPVVHPTPLYEIAGLLALHTVVGRVPARFVPALVASGFGALRIAVEPFRAAPPLGAPLLSPALLAALWLLVGLALVPRAGAARRATAGCGRSRPAAAAATRAGS